MSNCEGSRSTPGCLAATPRTDALIERFRAEKYFDVDDALDQAKQLERELADMEHTAAVLSETIKGQNERIATLNEMLDATEPGRSVAPSESALRDSVLEEAAQRFESGHTVLKPDSAALAAGTLRGMKGKK